MNFLVHRGEAKYDLKIFIFGRIVIIRKIWKDYDIHWSDEKGLTLSKI